MSEVTIDKEKFDELASGVATLTQSVKEMNEGKVDRSTVEEIARSVFEQSLEANPGLKQRGVTPPDVDTEADLFGKQGAARLHLIQTMPAQRVAALIKRDKGDVAEFQKAADKVVLLQRIMQAKDREYRVQESRFFNEEFLPLAQAMTTGGSGTGAEFVPKELSPDLIDRVELQQRVLALFNEFPMPTNPFDIPGRPVARTKLAQGTEQSGDTGQTGAKKIAVASRKITLTAKKFWGEALVSKEAEEDAIIAMLPYIQSELIRFMNYDLENAAINGDTAAAQDTQAGFYASDDPLKNWDGLRKMAPAGAKTDGANAALTVAMLRGNRKKMGVYGVSPDELAHILSINEYIDLLSDTAVFTLEKYGPNATILTGELAKVDNVPVIVSEAVSVGQNATGVTDGVTTNRTEALTVYRPGVGTGQRRGLTVEVLRELYSEYDQDAVKVSQRRALSALYPSTEAIVAITYNVKT